MHRTILAAIDLGSHSMAVLRRARAMQLEAHERGEDVPPVRVCHVMPDLSFVHPLLPHGGDQAAAFTTLERAVTDHAAELVRQSELEEVTFKLEHGAPYVRVVEAAAACEARRIIIGAHAWHEGASGTAARIVRHAHVPVLVEREAAWRGPIVVATDLSEPSLVAVREASKEAARRGRTLHVVHVVDTHPVLSILAATATAITVGPLPPIGTAPLRQASRALLESMVSLHAPGATYELREGRAASEVIECASALDASLLVIATHGHTGFDRALLGSVAERIVEQALCSVLVVRRAEAS